MCVRVCVLLYSIVNIYSDCTHSVYLPYAIMECVGVHIKYMCVHANYIHTYIH